MRAVRGNEISMIFQEPMTSLNPVLTVGRQIAESADAASRAVARARRCERAVEMLRLVNIPEPERRVAQYPHQLSGGMRQRVMIAMALACEPRLLIADEPTTALDVTIQAQILDLMRELKEKTGAAIMLITHDLGVVAEMAQRVVVMYAGRKVEEAPVARAVRAAAASVHARDCSTSIPRLGDSARIGARTRLAEIPGMVPSLRERAGRLHVRAALRLCDRALPREYPPLEAKAAGHFAACWESDRVARSGAMSATRTPTRAARSDATSPSTSRCARACSRA